MNPALKHLVFLAQSAPASPAPPDGKAWLFGLTGEELVQLANIGCGAVCVLCVILSAAMIAFTEINAAKSSLIKSFMRTCIWLAVISGVSSSALAWQNAAKVRMAEQKTEEVTTTGQALLAQVEESKTALASSQTAITALQEQVKALPVPEPKRAEFVRTIEQQRGTVEKTAKGLEHAMKAAAQVLDR